MAEDREEYEGRATRPDSLSSMVDEWLASAPSPAGRADDEDPDDMAGWRTTSGQLAVLYHHAFCEAYNSFERMGWAEPGAMLPMAHAVAREMIGAWLARLGS